MTAAVVPAPETGPFAHFLADMHSGDWIQAGLLGIAIVALLYTASTLKEQARARDFENYLALKERFSDAWRQFESAASDKKEFEFIELMNLFEGTCHLYVKKVVRGASREMIREYLRDMLPPIFGLDEARAMIDRAFSSPDNFLYIRKFARSENLPSVPQQ